MARRSRTASTTTSTSRSRSRRPTSSASRRRSAGRSRKGERQRIEISREEARERSTGEDEPYKVELVDTAGRRHFSTSREISSISPWAPPPGPSRSRPGNSSGRCVLARGRDEATADARLRDRILRSQDLEDYLNRLEEQAARPPAAEQDARHRRVLRVRARHAVLAPAWNGDLERARGPPASRGRRSAATTRCARRSSTTRPLAHVGPLRKYQEHMFRVEIEGRNFALKPMNCSRPLSPLRTGAPQLSRAAAAARGGRQPPSQRALRRPPRAPARAISCRTTRTSTAPSTRSRTSSPPASTTATTCTTSSS